jgi:hypothetical protein
MEQQYRCQSQYFKENNTNDDDGAKASNLKNMKKNWMWNDWAKQCTTPPTFIMIFKLMNAQNIKHHNNEWHLKLMPHTLQ